MSYLNYTGSSQNLAVRITNMGRKKIADGNFNLSYFQIGDSEYDYNSTIGGLTKVLMPFDYDSHVKYPYKMSESTITGTTYGTIVKQSYAIPTPISSFITEVWDCSKIIDNTSYFLGSKEFFGYGTTGYTSNSFAIIHYSKMGIAGDTFKYEDYISHDIDDVDTGGFEVITSVGTYTMGGTDLYIQTTGTTGLTDTFTYQMKYRELLSGTTMVGKIFVNSKVIVIENQSIVSSMTTTVSVKLRNSIDLVVMEMVINLPLSYFETTQNPTYVTGSKYLTEISLMNENKEVLVIGKFSKPMERVGSQVIMVQLVI